MPDYIDDNFKFETEWFTNHNGEQEKRIKIYHYGIWIGTFPTLKEAQDYVNGKW